MKRQIILLIAALILVSCTKKDMIEVNLKTLDGKQQVQRELENSISLIKTADGYLNECRDILFSTREILVKGANGIYSPEDRQKMIEDIKKNISQCNENIKNALFNGVPIFYTEKENFNSFQIVYSETESTEKLVINSPNYENGKNILTEMADGLKPSPESFSQSLASIDRAIFLVNRESYNLTSEQSRVEYAAGFINIFIEHQKDKYKIVEFISNQQFTKFKQRLHSLSAQGASGVYNDEDRIFINMEFRKLIKELKREERLSGLKSGFNFNGNDNLLTQVSAEKLMKKMGSLLK